MPILVADLASVGLFFGGVATAEQSPELAVGMMLAGLGTYVLGGPIVHFSEGRTGRGFASLGVRLGAPVVTGLGGAVLGAIASTDCEGEFCGVAGAAIGGIIGFVGGLIAAPIIDNTVFAYKDVPTKSLAWSILPSYQPVTGRAGLTLNGTW